ncbi:phage tail-collar fiber family protein [Yersinia rochesterensis]|uniref:Phage tail-collar fiber family protein n=1 Tax=Yersinia rochesterensis TaxID=1604335 RepID=A0ABN4F8Y2_9GAMM|nr:phage tail-collar fiber family protein [Yersinia frederiksenii Y225]AJJ34108.1 phage tail-collar fiber family protein [Yersinia rochesterensis]
MTTKFFAILTHLGAAKLANVTALGTQLQITQMAVGDGGGALPIPNPAQTQLLGEQRRAALNSLSIDAANSSQIIAEQVIPENEGGWWIREIGLFDKDGVLIAIANCPETYKPQLQEGSGRTQTVRVVLIVSSTEAVTLKIDPSVVLATRKYVDDKVIEVRDYADDLMEKHLLEDDPHPQYAPKKSPILTGIPTAPTPTVGDNTQQLANTAFVKAALTALNLGGAEKLPAATGLAAAFGYISVPALIAGVQRSVLIQWRTISIPPSPDGALLVVDGTWPIPFPTACLSIMQSMTGGVIYVATSPVLSSARIVDRSSFQAASSYTKSNSTITVWGVGY